MRTALPYSALLAGLLTSAFATGLEAQTTPVCGYTVVNSYPHDDEAFTQGLIYHDGFIFEGTGIEGASSIRRVELTTGSVLQRRDLDPTLFGEGITIFGEQLIQLTWQDEIGFVYDRVSFDQLDTFTYSTEGWGLTHDGMRLIMSDGTATLRFLDPVTFAVTGQVEVFDENGPVLHLNELEFIRGEILANKWLTDRIARINPDSGQVIAWIDLSGLLTPSSSTANVLNGIAFDNAGERLFVTGKWWPTLYEITLTDCQPLPIFADGFASGTTGAWSASE